MTSPSAIRQADCGSFPLCPDTRSWHPQRKPLLARIPCKILLAVARLSFMDRAPPAVPQKGTEPPRRPCTQDPHLHALQRSQQLQREQRGVHQRGSVQKGGLVGHVGRGALIEPRQLGDLWRAAGGFGGAVRARPSERWKCRAGQQLTEGGAQAVRGAEQGWRSARLSPAAAPVCSALPAPGGRPGCCPAGPPVTKSEYGVYREALANASGGSAQAHSPSWCRCQLQRVAWRLFLCPTPNWRSEHRCEDWELQSTGLQSPPAQQASTAGARWAGLKWDPGRPGDAPSLEDPLV